MADKKITRTTPVIGRPGLTVAEQRGLISGRSKDFDIQSIFKYGYRNKEDVSNLPASVLVVGSQNVLTNAAELIGIRQGYELDGPAGDQNDYGIDSSYDFQLRLGSTKNLRKWGPNLEVRYVDPNGVVTWVNILATLDAAYVANFTSFWDINTELKSLCLFVNHSGLVYEWSGGVAGFESATADTVTVSGTVSINILNFYTNASNSAKYKFILGGIEYTYTGISGTTFTGVTPDPTLGGHAVGDSIIQSVSSKTVENQQGFPTVFVFDLIATLENQVWYGSFANNTLYVSKTDEYDDCQYTTPARLPAEGAAITLDAYPVGLSPQATQMYCTAGQDQWWVSYKVDQTIDISGVATPTQVLAMSRLKTALNQAAQSQSLIGRYKNSLVFVSNEPIINALGLVKNINQEPQIVNISDPIKYDVDAYDFTGGDVEYDNYYIYVSAPVNGVVRMYNVQKQYWEAPQTIPVGKFYHVNSAESGNLFGHSNLTNESYQLFTGKSDNGNPINFVAAFPYVSEQAGASFQLKSFNKIYTEGYIAANTTLMVTINYDFGGFSGTYTTIINGADPAILFNRITDGSLGHNSLGSQPIGTILNLPFDEIAPKFRIINTMPRVNFFEYQIVYATQDDDANVTILRFGPGIEGAQALPNNITF